MKEFRFKIKNKSEQYPGSICCASRCSESTDVIYAAKGEDLPLCDRHWELFCIEAEENG